jgi:CBS domain containing-hemolysin-like protein
MQTIFILGFTVLGATLTLVASMLPRRTVLSAYELTRRRDEGSESAAEELRREALLDDILTLKQVAEALLLVFTVLASFAAFGPVFGTLVAVLVALIYGRLSRIDMIHSWAQMLYEHSEPVLLQFVERHPHLGRIIRSVKTGSGEQRLSSREELEHMIEESGAVITADEKKLISNGLAFADKTVEQIMTPRGVVETIAKDELIGPLTLDELHRTGHSRFPVIDGDIDHVVGMLHIKELLTSFDKKSQTAEKMMERKVFYINQDQTLDHALAAFIKTRHHLFVVVNGYRETAGILTLEDVLEALLGREIVDEYDIHDDLRVVAARNAKTNNNPPHGTNV